MLKTTKYKEFTIAPDNYYGFSLIDPRGGWCTSKTSIDALKKIVDEILVIDEENRRNPQL
jgi:hypothetical protein